ncbi:hypothetical protein [Brevundimonas sp. FT23028]|uniref:hypothetical protein n=1 Tax=Brevundimonas sp. FT23028 TaxID=3393748 RepID=UPI003B58B00E
MISILASLLALAVQAGAEQQATSTCANIYFVGFQRSNASVVSDETRWEGLLDDYDPSTDLSAAFRLCPVTGSIKIATASGEVTVPLPEEPGEVHILVDSRNVTASTARPTAPLLD